MMSSNNSILCCEIPIMKRGPFSAHKSLGPHCKLMGTMKGIPPLVTEPADVFSSLFCAKVENGMRSFFSVFREV